MADNMDLALLRNVKQEKADKTPTIVQSLERFPTIYEIESGEDIPTHWGFTCQECEVHTVRSGTYVMKEWPIRCKKNGCEKMKSRYVRAKKMKKRVRKQFKKLKNPHVGFLTLTLPGEYAGRITTDIDVSLLQARRDLYACWTKFWRNYLKSHCSGAYRFFEWTENPYVVQEHLDDTDPTTVSLRVHPHLHVLVLQEGRTIKIRELRSKAKAAGFGDQIDMQWKKSTDGFSSIDYCLSYVKKDLQMEGRNRQGYGVFHGKRL